MAAELNRQLNSKVDLNTIDRIWDEYLEHSPGGRSYARRYRPSTTQPRSLLADARAGEYDLNWWINHAIR